MTPAVVKKKVMKKGKAREITLIKLKNPGSVDLKNYNTQIDPLVLSQKKVQHKSGRDIRLGDLKGFNKPVWLEEYGSEVVAKKIWTKVSIPAGKSEAIKLASLGGHSGIIDDIDEYNTVAPPTGTDDDIHKVEVTGISSENQSAASNLAASTTFWSGPDGILGGHQNGNKFSISPDGTIHIIANHLSEGRESNAWVYVAAGGPAPLSGQNSFAKLFLMDGELYGGNRKNFLHFDSTNKVWEITDTASEYLVASIIFGGDLYFALYSGDLYKWDSVNGFVKSVDMVGTTGGNSIGDLIEHGGYVYASGEFSNGKFYRCVPGVDSEWTELVSFSGFGQQSYNSGLVIFNNKVHWLVWPGGRLYEWDNGFTLKASLRGIRCLYVHDGKIFGGNTYVSDEEWGALYEWEGSGPWVKVAPRFQGTAYYENSWIKSLYEFDGALFGGVGNTGSLLQYNGSNAWIRQALGVGPRQTYVTSMIEYDGKLYGLINGTLYYWDGDVIPPVEGNRIVHYYSQDGGKTWEHDFIDDSVYVSGDEFTDPASAFDSQDNQHSAWIKGGGGIFYRKNDGQCELIDNGIDSDFQDSVCIIVDNQENVHVAWTATGFGTYPTKKNVQYRMRSASTGEWGDRELLTDQDEDCNYFCMDLDEDGYVHIGFQIKGDDAPAVGHVISSDNGLDKHIKYSGFSDTVTDSYAAPMINPWGIGWDGENVISQDISWGKHFIHTGFSDTISSSYMVPDAWGPSGITWDGSNVISCDYGNDEVIKWTGYTASITDSFSTLTVDSYFYGITWDNDNSYLIAAGDSSEMHFKLSGFSDTILDSYYTPYSYLRDLTWDGTNVVAASSATGEKIFKHSGFSDTIANSFASAGTDVRSAEWTARYQTGESAIGAIWYLKGKSENWGDMELASWNDKARDCLYLDGLVAEGSPSRGTHKVHILFQQQDGGSPDKLQFCYVRRDSLVSDYGWSEIEAITNQAVGKGSGSMAVNKDRQVIVIYGRDEPNDGDPEEIFYRRRNYGMNDGTYRIENPITSDIVEKVLSRGMPDAWWTPESNISGDQEFECKSPTLVTNKWPIIDGIYANQFQQGFMFIYAQLTEAYSPTANADLYLISVEDAVIGNMTEGEILKSQSYKTKTRGVISKAKINKPIIQRRLIG